ncbi:esterase FE4-like [Planococcus citri]|uniref:esterase FE4-like n=1 Tax=Planococcus citri TaxID=170843 RepID=UPI0031F7653F
MIVQTKLGPIRGKECESLVNGKKFYSFLGIPYAKPPIGELRFMPPVRAEGWLGIYDGTFDRDPCTQGETITGTRFVGSEDCLYLNIHTTEISSTKLKPVMFYIHGGGYLQGSGLSTYRGADYLMHRDVILVTINYRLNCLGFLNLGIPECPGNVALKDQLMALKWVKNNIKEFGGDPDNITLFGSSAGGACVNFFLVSPLAKGLFQKAIIQSGTALAVWALTHRPTEIAFMLGRKLGYQGDDPRSLVQHLKTLPAVDLIRASLAVFGGATMKYPMTCFVPVFVPSVEKDAKNAFLPDYPEKLWPAAEPKLCMFGHNGLEASIMWPIIPESARKDAMKIFPHVLKNNFQVSNLDLDSVTEKIREFYGCTGDQSETEWQKMLQFVSDVFDYRFHDSYVYLQQAGIPPYVFFFSYYNPEAAAKSKGIRQRLAGSFHGEEEEFLFVQKYPPIPLRVKGDDLKVMNNICNLWTNFAKFGNPTEGMNNVDQWKPSTTDSPHYLQIDKDLKLIEGKLGSERSSFLANVLDNAEIIDIL